LSVTDADDAGFIPVEEFLDALDATPLEDR
jgi:hypothetical protein